MNFRGVITLLSLLFLGSCKFYSFTGASISPDMKTMQIEQFSNNASIVYPLLSQIVSEKLRDKFVSQTSLQLVKSSADILVTGIISDYSVSPVGFLANQTNALNRLTISVKVNFKYTKNPENNWEQVFTNYADFSSDVTFTQAESQLVGEITRQLSDNIFNRAFVNW